MLACECNATACPGRVSKDTDHLAFGAPRLARMTRQYLAVPANQASASLERFFSRVGLVNFDLRGSLWTPP